MMAISITTQRLIITTFLPSMAKDVHLNSLDEQTRQFNADEVFDTEQDALDTITFLISCYAHQDGPFVFPILLQSGENIGYVQADPIDDAWEVGYHIAKDYRGKGYATEALTVFAPYIMQALNIHEIWGICHKDNIASHRVLEKAGFSLHDHGQGVYKGHTQGIYKYLLKQEKPSK